MRSTILSSIICLICLSLVSPVPAQTESGAPSRRLTNQELENLIAFTRLFGYVRYFHPSDAAANLDWNRFAIHGVRSVQSARNSEELCSSLNQLFTPFAPTVRVFLNDAKMKPPLYTPDSRDARTLSLVAWVHRGPDFTNPYHYLSERVERTKFPAQASFPDPNQPFTALIGSGIRCEVPLSLYKDSLGTLPHTTDTSFPLQNADPPRVILERDARLADVVVAWNILQHLYPYFDAVTVDWMAVLRTSLQHAAQESTIIDHRNTMKWMQAQLNDGHGVASDYREPNAYRQWWLPFTVAWIDRNLVVTKLSRDTVKMVHVGDIITRVDGTPTAEFFTEQERFVPGATPDMKRWWSAFYFTKPLVDSIALEVRVNSGDSQSITYRRHVDTTTYRRSGKLPQAESRELRPGIYYIDLEWASQSTIDSMSDRLAKAKGIIFDLRSYPNYSGDEFLNHLVDSTISGPHYFSPFIVQPDRTRMTFVPAEPPSLYEPHAPRFHGRIVFLTGPRAISFSEHVLLMVKQYKLGTIIGETTAGTNGNINWVTLPSGYDFVWTALRTMQYDGSRFMGVGVTPDIPVYQTLRGFVLGQDDALERALTSISN